LSLTPEDRSDLISRIAAALIDRRDEILQVTIFLQVTNFFAGHNFLQFTSFFTFCRLGNV
jgi:hypothetical protein